MSKYTTTLRSICEVKAGKTESEGYTAINDIIALAAPQIFENFPIYKESHREELERKILRHYYMREIGFETAGLFLLHLNNRLFEIMPEFNELYKTLDLDYNIFDDIDYTVETTGTTTNTGTSDNTSHGTDTNTSTNDLHTKMRRSDTPQGGLSGIESENYLSEARLDDNTGSVTSTMSGDRGTTRTDNLAGSNHSVVKHSGKTGGHTYSALIKEYRDNIINVDNQIIKRLSDLFMNIY